MSSNIHCIYKKYSETLILILNCITQVYNDCSEIFVVTFHKLIVKSFWNLRPHLFANDLQVINISRFALMNSIFAINWQLDFSQKIDNVTYFYNVLKLTTIKTNYNWKITKWMKNIRELFQLYASSGYCWKTQFFPRSNCSSRMNKLTSKILR